MRIFSVLALLAAAALPGHRRSRILVASAQTGMLGITILPTP